jgi:ferredoxin
MSTSTRERTRHRLVLDPVRCDGRGLCHELVPEIVGMDEWGFPLLADGLAADVPDHLVGLAGDAVAACPVLALRLTRPRA